MSDEISAVIFFSVVGVFAWFVLRLHNKRQEAFKQLAGEFARRHGVTAGHAINNWKADTQVFEWEADGLKIAVTGGSKAIAIPGASVPVVGSSAMIYAAFTARTDFTFMVRRSMEESNEPEKLARLLADPALRAGLSALFDSSIRSGVLNQDGMTMSFFDLDDFQAHAADVLPMAKLAAARLKTL